MLHGLEVIRAKASAKRFEIGELLFAQITCPAQDEPLGIWSHVDHLIHVLTAKSRWRLSTGTWSAEAGETVFFKKGAYILPPHFEENLCVLLVFVPDAFIRDAVRELAPDLPAISQLPDWPEPAIRINHDAAFSAFLEAMAIYFSADEPPPEALLKLKLKELIASIVLGQSNPVLSAYFRSMISYEAPPIAPIMEANFRYNLELKDFARLCHRSLSSFKRAFQTHYGIPPGKWLLKRRLEHAATLLRTTGMSVTQIVFESGFEDASHFCHAFKQKFGQTPSDYRAKPVSASLVSVGP